MYLPLLLSLTLGTRISETIGIRYSDIDFTSYTVYIETQLKWYQNFWDILPQSLTKKDKKIKQNCEDINLY